MIKKNYKTKEIELIIKLLPDSAIARKIKRNTYLLRATNIRVGCKTGFY